MIEQKKKKLLEQKKKIASTFTSFKNKDLDGGIDQAMDLKIEGMIEFKKSTKKFLNNPTQKETNLQTKTKPVHGTITQPGFFYAFIPLEFRVECPKHGGEWKPYC